MRRPASARGLMGSVHVAQARFEVEHARDPGAALARAREELHAAMEQNSQDAEMWLQLGKAQALQVRWKEQHGPLPPEAMEETAKSFEKAITLSPDEPEYRLEAGVFYRQWAEQRKRSGHEDGPKLQRGFELAEQVLKARSDWPVALALRASIRLELAETASPQNQRTWRSQALTELTQALANNPNLTHEWSGPLAVARRLSTVP